MTDGNEPAYPNVGPELPWAQFPGLTKREYFAAMAMQGLLANRDVWAVEDHAGIALNARNAADALIATLNKEQPHA